MLSKWPIRNKLLTGIGLLIVIVATLSWSGFHGVYAYRYAARSFRCRAAELPLAQDLSRALADMRVLVAEAGAAAEHEPAGLSLDLDRVMRRVQFADHMVEVRTTLDDYRRRLRDLLHLDGRQEELRRQGAARLVGEQ